MTQNSRIGNQYKADYLKKIPDEVILVEAAMRRGESMTTLIKPSSPSLQKIGLQQWKNAYLAARNVDFPNLNPLYEVYDNSMIDNTLTSMIDTRILKVQQAKFNVFDKSKKPNPELAYFFERPWFPKFLRFAMESRFEGYRLGEFFNFKENGEIADCNVVNKYHVKPKKGIVTKEANDDHGWDYLNGNQSLFYIPIGDPDDLGLLYKAAPHILAKKFALGVWGEFNEKIGIPFRTVHTAISDNIRQGQLAVIMENMGSAGWAVLNKEEEVKLLEVKGTDPTKCFEGLINKMDAEVAMLILGQTATSNSSNNKGTYGSMKILQEISDDRHEADLTFIKYLVNDVLIPRMILWGYKGFNEETYFDWDKSVDLSVDKTIEYVMKLSEKYIIPAEFVTEKTGIPIDGLVDPVSKTKTSPAAAAKKKNINIKLSAFYAGCCAGHSHNPVAADPDKKFEEIVLDVAKKLYEGRQQGVVDMKLLKATATNLREAITTGYGKTPEDKDFDVRDYEMLKSLQKNIFVFSGFKTYQQLREITDLIRDKQGNVRNYGEFKNDVLKVNERYNLNYLKAEYDHAIVSSQMASQWIDIQRNKDVLPMLEFDATMDDRTTSTCRSLNGMRLPVDHEAWKTYYLPLHWHERSVIRQVSGGKSTDISTVDFPKLQPMFKGNVGIDGVAFPENHPYYEASKSDKKQIEKAVIKATPKSLLEEFTLVKKGGKTIQVSSHVNDLEADYNKKMAFAFADKYEVKVLGHFKDRTSPDLSLDGMIAEIKTPAGDNIYAAVRSSLQNGLNQRYKQMSSGIEDPLQIKAFIIDLNAFKTIKNELIEKAITDVFAKTKVKGISIFITKGKKRLVTGTDTIKLKEL